MKMKPGALQYFSLYKIQLLFFFPFNFWVKYGLDMLL